MATLNTMFRKLLNVNTAIFTNMRIETNEKGVSCIYVEAKINKKQANRCPICGRKCPGYDKGSNKVRRWRALDIGGLILFIETSQARIYCDDHGVQYPSVPWAYEGSRFTKEFDMTAAWLACQLSKKATSEFLRIDWETVGRCIARARNDIEPDLKKRLDGLVHIGIDETSYRKGFKYITVIVDHDRNRVVWLHEGHGKSVLEKFYKELTDKQRKNIKVVTGDGARWITECVEKYTPECVRCMDSFHVVEWANAALDEVRIKAWRDANVIVKALEEKYGKIGKGKPAKDNRNVQKILNARKEAYDIKGSSFAVGKAPEHLTERQRETLENIRRCNSKFYRAYEMKESLRLILRCTNRFDAECRLKSWLWWAAHSRIEAFKELAKKVRRNMEFILNTISYGLSNARIEATNNKIKLVIRRSYGFRNIDSMLNMIYLTCSDIKIPLPNRPIVETITG